VAAAVLDESHCHHQTWLLLPQGAAAPVAAEAWEHLGPPAAVALKVAAVVVGVATDLASDPAAAAAAIAAGCGAAGTDPMSHHSHGAAAAANVVVAGTDRVAAVADPGPYQTALLEGTAAAAAAVVVVVVVLRAMVVGAALAHQLCCHTQQR